MRPQAAPLPGLVHNPRDPQRRHCQGLATTLTPLIDLGTGEEDLSVTLQCIGWNQGVVMQATTLTDAWAVYNWVQ